MTKNFKPILIRVIIVTALALLLPPMLNLIVSGKAGVYSFWYQLTDWPDSSVLYFIYSYINTPLYVFYAWIINFTILYVILLIVTGVLRLVKRKS